MSNNPIRSVIFYLSCEAAIAPVLSVTSGEYALMGSSG